MSKIVLMYHDIYCDSVLESGFPYKSTSQYKLRVDEFESHVKAVKEYCDVHDNVEVVFTFDDGGVSFFTLAAPMLEKYGFRGIFFISTKYLNTPTFLTNDQLSELVQRGHVIGSHTHTHSILTDLSNEEIENEWSESIKCLSRYIRDDVIASIPQGYGNTAVVKKALKARIRELYTSVPTIKIEQVEDMLIIGRYVVYQGMTSDDVINIIANKWRRRMMYAKWCLLSGFKTILGKKYDVFKAFILKIIH